ncbi:MAG: AAA family ATPase [Pseudomonadales bacterium]|nr:AAA family ATPase [Pseudomonadales bacterium]
MNPLQQQYQLISSLQCNEAYPHPTSDVSVIETHISWVLLTGSFAYKLKKHLDYGFLDYTSLEKRKHCCEEELRLNSRYSQGLYLSVVPITGSIDAPYIDGSGEIIDYAVKMTEFTQDQLLDRTLNRGEINPQQIDELAICLAEFHELAPVAEQIEDMADDTLDNNLDLGSFAAVIAPVIGNFEQLKSLATISKEPVFQQQLLALNIWTQNEIERLAPLLQQRKSAGFIRECHGDLHLGNMAILDGQITFFDGIEFNEQFRWIDTISELAYLLMDLENRGQRRWANRLLNKYLEYTGDFKGLSLLQFYKVYRALIRAKVAALRLNQDHLPMEEQQQCHLDCQQYLQLASSYTQDRPVFLAITHGVSASGKTTYSGLIAEQCQAIRLRSDIERKRLCGLSPLANSHSSHQEGIYTLQASRQTFNHIEKLAQQLIQARLPVIVDATFLSADLRLQFQRLAERLNVPFIIIDCQAEQQELTQRLSHKPAKDASEADLSTLKYQQIHEDSLTAKEQPFTHVIMSTQGLHIDAYRQLIDQQSH